jgi:hypothetical protein
MIALFSLTKESDTHQELFEASLDNETPRQRKTQTPHASLCQNKRPLRLGCH